MDKFEEMMMLAAVIGGSGAPRSSLGRGGVRVAPSAHIAKKAKKSLQRNKMAKASRRGNR